MITVSAPGKIHLLGEHTVVYGKPAWLTAINRRISVSVDLVGSDVVIDHSESQVKDFVSYAIQIVKEHYQLSSLPGMTIHIRNEFPFGYHLGSSAALAVATVGAVIYATKKLWNPTEINKLAYEVEKKQHGNPSGGDNTISTFGGVLWFRKELEFLKSIWQLPFKIPKEVERFFLINTGKPVETTGEMVALVKVNKEQNEEKFQKLLNENEQQTKNLAKALKKGNENGIIEAIKEGERTLEDIGVVSDIALPIIHLIENNGGAAKILGGGGKRGAVGFLLGYHPNPHSLDNLLHSMGYAIEDIELGEEGVRLEHKN